MHEREEQARMKGFNVGVANLVNQQAIVGQVTLEHPRLGVIGGRLEEFRNQVGEKHIFSPVAAFHGMEHEAGGKPRLAGACRANPDDVPLLGHVIEGVV